MPFRDLRCIVHGSPRAEGGGTSIAAAPPTWRHGHRVRHRGCTAEASARLVLPVPGYRAP